MSIPRPEYPRPQLTRDSWLNLNGAWQFEFDPGKSGVARGLPAQPTLSGSIMVPFCPESRLSGIGDVDFHPAVWYKRAVTLTDAQRAGRVLLRFQACDYHTEVWVNGQKVGWHDGGYSSFAFDITKQVVSGENLLTVYAEDDVRAGTQPSGKQCEEYHSRGCSYTRTTGIWQTVWMEFVPETYISMLRITPNAAAGRADVEAVLTGDTAGCALRVSAMYNGKPVGSAEEVVSGQTGSVRVALSEVHLWDVGCPELYDLCVELRRDAETIDTVGSYFGLRDIALRSGCTYLNGHPVFQRLVLDQGFNPEGIYTGPTDAFLKGDIELSMSLGFNGARLHQRIFEERTLYWADKLGYLLWGEFPSWGIDTASANGVKYFVKEWTEVVLRDRNHPALIGWCPFNETWNPHQDRYVVTAAYELTKALDPTRIVIDTSGGNHYTTDMFDIHDYEQNPEEFRKNYADLGKGVAFKGHTTFGEWQGEPFWVSEYGGTWWNPDEPNPGWGYGVRPQSEQEVCDRYVGLTDVLLSNPHICAFCYTQLTDVEQEQNGLVKYDRSPKFSEQTYAAIRRANTARAAIEE